MTRRSINVYHRDGFPARVLANDPSLADVEINFIADDAPDRLLFVRLAVEDEFERMRKDQRSCHANTQSLGLSLAAECAAEGLMALRLEHHGDPDALNAAIQQVVDQLADNRRTAMSVRSDGNLPTAHGGHHQQPRITIKRKEPADV